MTDRSDQLDALYVVLARLEDSLGGKRRLAECDSTTGWPARGVYFFFEDGEVREDGQTPRVVRVGTHALRASSTTLWRRLAQHKGNVGGVRPGGGNHRGSIFRQHVGAALVARGDWPSSMSASWGVGSTAPTAVRAEEFAIERAVSAYIGAMQLLCVAVEDAPAPRSDRGVIEAGTIALLSNYDRPPVDPPSGRWLGCDAPSERVRFSGLWNVNHVRQHGDPRTLDVLAEYVAQMRRPPHNAS